MQVTINDFVRYRELKSKCERLERQIARLEEYPEKEATDRAKGSRPHHPYTEMRVPIVGLLHNTARINAKKDELAEMSAEAQKLLDGFKAFLPTIEDNEVRETLELYYIDGLSYRQIAAHLGMEGDGSTQMKKVHRHMRKVSALSANECDIV